MPTNLYIDETEKRRLQYAEYFGRFVNRYRPEKREDDYEQNRRAL